MSYYSDAASRSIVSALGWPNSHGVLFAAMCLLFGVLFRVAVMHWWPLSGTASPIWSLLGELGAIALAGFLLACLAVFLWFFLTDAPAQVRIRDERITQLGGAPDTSVRMSYLSTAEAEKVRSSVSALSDFINKEARDACEMAKTALACVQNIRSLTPSECASKADQAFNKARSVLTELLGTSAATGVLNAGDPIVIDAMNQAIQRKDRQVIIDFDDYGRRARNSLHFLSLIEHSPDERARLLEPALNVADSDLNGWSSATQRFCEFISKTNGRITDIRSQLSRGAK